MSNAGPKEDMASSMSRPDMQLCFSEVLGDIHGPLHLAHDKLVEQILQRREGAVRQRTAVRSGKKDVSLSLYVSRALLD